MTRSLWLMASATLLIAAVAVSFVVGYRAAPQTTVVIVGPSMAETLYGRHGRATCKACRQLFSFDLEDVPFPAYLVCPNCGEHLDEGTDVDIREGSYAWMDRDAKQFERFDIVAMQVPDMPGMLGVKRIIGLPGERVSIVGGDIFINGRILQKSLLQESLLTTRVHDDSGVSVPRRPSRWIGADESPNWQEVCIKDTLRTYEFRAPPSSNEIQWLTYRHGRNFDSPGPAPAMLLDSDSYNQSLARELNDVFDYGLQISVHDTEFGAGKLVVAMHDGWQRWHVEITQHEVRIVRDDAVVAQAARPTSQAKANIECRLCDERLRVVWNGEELIAVSTSLPLPMPRRLPPDFLAIGAAGMDVTISCLAIGRDIYYLNPLGNSQAWSMDRPLGPDEYFLLGDNPPVSVDSRQFGPIKAAAIVGKIVPPPDVE